MKLSYKPYNILFDLETTRLNSIVIEEPRLYGKMVESLYRQMDKLEESWALLKGGDLLHLNKTCELILSPLDLRFDSKPLQKKLLDCLAAEVEESDIYEKIISIHAKIVSLLDEVRDCSAFSVAFSEELVLKDYLKWHDVHLKNPEGSFVERLIEYMDTVRELTGKYLYLLVGCADYLPREDYIHLEKWVQYQEIYVIFLGSRQLESGIDVNEYIIDSDLCEIH